jgi:transketolase
VTDLEKIERDYFLLSNGHACPALYAVLAESDYFDRQELDKLRKLGAGAQGHPHRGSLPGVEISSGSLGQGLSVGVGLSMALNLRRKKNGANAQGAVFVMMSDGEQEEGSTWEAIMFATKNNLQGLVAIVDKNGWQIDGATKEVMPGLDSLADKYRAFNWEVREVDGHDHQQLIEVLTEARESERPTAVIAETVRGKGVSFMENSEHWHAGAITEEQYEQAMEELGGVE